MSRSNIWRWTIFALLLARSPRSVRRALAFMIMGAVLAVAVIVLSVAARAELLFCTLLREPKVEASCGLAPDGCERLRARYAKEGRKPSECFTMEQDRNGKWKQLTIPPR